MSQDAKALITMGIVATFAFALFIWPSVGPPLWPAIVGGLFTLGAAALAAFVVFRQLRKQAENTDASNRKIEAMKLKKELYSEVFKTCDEAIAALAAIDRYVLEGWAELKELEQLQELGQLPQPHPKPDFSVPKLQEKYEVANEALKKLAALPQKWEIVEPKIWLFRPAFTLASELRGGAFAGLLRSAYRAFTPFDGQLPWHFESSAVREYEVSMSALKRETNSEKGYVDDFLVAMQNALLGDLFYPTKVHLPRREDSKAITIDIDQPEAVFAQIEALKKSTGYFDMSQR